MARGTSSLQQHSLGLNTNLCQCSLSLPRLKAPTFSIKSGPEYAHGIYSSRQSFAEYMTEIPLRRVLFIRPVRSLSCARGSYVASTTDKRVTGISHQPVIPSIVCFENSPKPPRYPPQASRSQKEADVFGKRPRKRPWTVNKSLAELTAQTRTSQCFCLIHRILSGRYVPGPGLCLMRAWSVSSPPRASQPENQLLLGNCPVGPRCLQ